MNALFFQELPALSQQGLEADLAHISTLLLERGWMLATAESCTGGLVAAACTSLAGSSQWFERGVVSYSNLAKHELLGVEEALIAQHGAVSEPVARAMAQGLVVHSAAQVALSITGVAGPGGGTADKPVGLVWFGWALPGQCHSACQHFSGPRAAVRTQAVAYALAQLRALLQAPPAA